MTDDARSRRDEAYARLAGTDGCREMRSLAESVRVAEAACRAWLADHPLGCDCDWCEGLRAMRRAIPGGPDPGEHRELVADAQRDLARHRSGIDGVYLPPDEAGG